MKLVIDTNILFSFFLHSSTTRKLILTTNFELVSPKLALEELFKYSEEIITKAGIKKQDFQKDLEALKGIVKFIEKEDYLPQLNAAEEISPDKADAEFFALCLKFNCILWSNDFVLKEQDKIRVLSTGDIINLIL